MSSIVSDRARLTCHCSRPPTLPPIEVRVMLTGLAWGVFCSSVAAGQSWSREVIAVGLHRLLAHVVGG